VLSRCARLFWCTILPRSFTVVGLGLANMIFPYQCAMLSEQIPRTFGSSPPQCSEKASATEMSKAIFHSHVSSSANPFQRVVKQLQLTALTMNHALCKPIGTQTMILETEQVNQTLFYSLDCFKIDSGLNHTSPRFGKMPTM
jgi:hypothetical protein